MFYQVKAYFLFLWKSTTKYGVHSPFVFNLITKCFDSDIDDEKINKFNEYKQFLNSNDTVLNVTDFGAGSRVFKSTNRKVLAIAKNAGISTKRAHLLIRLMEYFEINQVLEIGTSLGIGTLALALGNKESKIITLEGCPETVRIPKKNLKKHIDNEVNFIIGEFGKTLPEVVNQKYDLIYFDGNHQAKPTINYFEQCLKTIHNDTLFIFDDIHWSKEMTNAWRHIRGHEKATLTIDTFYWGFVFFRKEQQEKEHFVIRV